MPKLSDQFVEAVRPAEEDSFFWDDTVSGFGLKVTAKGSRIFILQHRVAGDTLMRQYKLGTYSKMHVDQARRIAVDLKNDVAKVAKSAVKSVSPSKIKKSKPHLLLLGELVENYLESYVGGPNKSDVVESLLTDVLPRCGGKALAEISLADTRDMLEACSTKFSLETREELAAAFSEIFGWGSQSRRSSGDPATDAGDDWESVAGKTSKGLTNKGPSRSTGNAANLLDAARKVFLRDGYKVSLDVVAQEANVTRRTIYNQFGSKERLFREVIAAIDQRLDIVQHIGWQRPLRQTLEELAHKYVAGLLDQEALALFRVTIAEVDEFPDLAKTAYDCGPGVAIPALSKYFRKEIEAGNVKEMDTEFAAERFFSSVLGQARIRASLRIGDDDQKRRHEYVQQSIDEFVKSIQISQ